MEDWMRRRIEVFRREKERSIVKLSGSALRAVHRDLPYTAAIISNTMWIGLAQLIGIRQFEEWYSE